MTFVLPQPDTQRKVTVAPAARVVPLARKTVPRTLPYDDSVTGAGTACWSAVMSPENEPAWLVCGSRAVTLNEPTNTFANDTMPPAFVLPVRIGAPPRMLLARSSTAALGTGVPAPLSTVTFTVPRPRKVIGTLTSRPLWVTDAFVRPWLPLVSDATRM